MKFILSSLVATLALCSCLSTSPQVAALGAKIGLSPKQTAMVAAVIDSDARLAATDLLTGNSKALLTDEVGATIGSVVAQLNAQPGSAPAVVTIPASAIPALKSVVAKPTTKQVLTAAGLTLLQTLINAQAQPAAPATPSA